MSQTRKTLSEIASRRAKPGMADMDMKVWGIPKSSDDPKFIYVCPSCCYKGSSAEEPDLSSGDRCPSGCSHIIQKKDWTPLGNAPLPTFVEPRTVAFRVIDLTTRKEITVHREYFAAVRSARKASNGPARTPTTVQSVMTRHPTKNHSVYTGTVFGGVSNDNDFYYRDVPIVYPGGGG